MLRQPDSARQHALYGTHALICSVLSKIFAPRIAVRRRSAHHAPQRRRRLKPCATNVVMTSGRASSESTSRRKRRAHARVSDLEQLAAEWHPTANGTARPENASPWSNELVWWRCQKASDHVWQTRIISRARSGAGCPFCAGRMASSTTSLATDFPEIASEWNHEKNGALRPEDVTRGSQRSVWWVCSRSPEHVWQARIANRVLLGTSCPLCAHKRTTSETSLLGRFPEIASEWHPTKNGRLRPEDVTPFAHRKAWWACRAAQDHVWKTWIGDRVNGVGCPFCSGRRASITNSIAQLHPELAAEWHPTKNRESTPASTSSFSSTSVWWQCPRGPDHEWMAPPSARRNGIGCPHCNGAAVSVTNSLATLQPDLVAQWNWERNGSLSPATIHASSGKLVWWRCPLGPDHEWRAAPYSRVRSGGCPFCQNRRLSVTNSLAAIRPDLAAEWDLEKNDGLSPEDVIHGSFRSGWWCCAKNPEHRWQSTVAHRIRHGCPFCANRRCSADNNLAACDPALAAEWHPTKNGALTAADVVPGSHKRVWWRCAHNSSHEWEATVTNRSSGTGCPYCAGKRFSMGDSLAMVFPGLACEWHPSRNGEKRPDGVAAASNDQIWWRCPLGHDWRSRVRDRTVRHLACPICAEEYGRG